MPNDQVIKATRRFSYCAGITLLVLPIILTMTLDILELPTLPSRLSRDVFGFMMALAFAMFASVMLDFSLTITSLAERLAPKESGPAATQIRRPSRTPCCCTPELWGKRTGYPRGVPLQTIFLHPKMPS